MDYDELLDKLNIRLGDSDNFTFTPEEKQEALDEAFNDDFVISPVWNTSLSYSTGTYQYALPNGLTVVQDIYIKPDNNQDNPQSIEGSSWSVVGTNIQFSGAPTVPNGYGLYIKGKYRYTTDDTVAETNVQEYILNLAQRHCLKMLGTKKALRFLKNDTSMSEVIAIKRELDAEIQSYRRRLPTSWESA